MTRHYLGRTADRERVHADIVLREISPSHMADHSGTRPDPDGASRSILELSVCGDVTAYRHREPHSVGQVCVDFLTVTEPGPGWTLEDITELVAVWRKWHLNGLSATCHHMDVTGLGRDYDARKHVTCPVTGDAYGSAWWARELPAEVVAKVREWQARG